MISTAQNKGKTVYVIKAKYLLTNIRHACNIAYIQENKIKKRFLHQTASYIQSTVNCHWSMAEEIPLLTPNSLS